MSFASVLDAYCKALGCTNKEIAEECGISPSALSRYRNGERTPDIGSDVIDGIVAGIAKLAHEREDGGQWRADAIRNALERSLSGFKLLGMSFSARMNALMELLDLRNAEIARSVGVSPSYVSRIRNGQRMPADQRLFALRISQQAAGRCVDQGKIDELVALVDSTGKPADREHLDLDSYSDLSEVIERWLLGNNVVESDLVAVEHLFERFNEFYFEERLGRILGLAPVESKTGEPEQFARFFYDKEGMREAGATFFDITAAYNVSEVYLSSDVPILEMSIDTKFIADFGSKISSLVRNGSHISVIHEAERPLAETAMALERWLPLYLTGNVTPYYLKGFNRRLFYHVNYVSDACVMSAEAVMGHQSSGRCYLSTKPEDLSYYRRKMDCIMNYASPMLELYFSDEFESHDEAVSAAMGTEKPVGGHAVGVGRYENLRITSFPGQCAVVTILYKPAIHLVIRHPKLRYVISHMR